MTNASITVGKGKKTAIIKEQNPQGQRKRKLKSTTKNDLAAEHFNDADGNDHSVLLVNLSNDNGPDGFQ